VRAPVQGVSRDPAVEALLSRRRFTPIYRDLLADRKRRLVDRLRSKTLREPVNVLLVNATLGLKFYPSIVDFFVTLRATRPGVKVTSSSYFDEIQELSASVARRGVPVVPIGTVMKWTAAELSRFDLVIAVGPSDAFARLMAMEGLEPKLVLLDLGFYHQVIAATRGSFLSKEKDGAAMARARAQTTNAVTCYSCQPPAKARKDLFRYFSIRRFTWRWFPYIPIGFQHGDYYRCDEPAFDVALPGTDGREYALLLPEFLRGIRFLFLGSPDRAPAMQRLRSELDITVVSGVSEDDYARLLALCRCVVVPLTSPRDNVLLSVVDSLASGKPIITGRRPGFEELERAKAPLVFYDERYMSPEDVVGLRATLGRAVTAFALAGEIRKLLNEEDRRLALGESGMRFAMRHLDICRILETILEEQAS
jgi:glycosyltransferase involved in cell wall biosynthesis